MTLKKLEDVQLKKFLILEVLLVSEVGLHGPVDMRRTWRVS